MAECRFIKQDGWIEIYKQNGWIENYKTRRVAGKGKQWLLVTQCTDYVYTSLYISYLYSMSLSNISLVFTKSKLHKQMKNLSTFLRDCLCNLTKCHFSLIDMSGKNNSEQYTLNLLL